MHDQVGLETLLPALTRGPHRAPPTVALHPAHLRRQLHGHTELARALDQQVDQVWIEGLEGARAAVQDGDLRAGLRRHVRELKRDVAASDEHDAARQLGELHELLAGRDVLAAGKGQRHGHRPGCDQDVASDQSVRPDLDRRGPHEARSAMEEHDAGLGPPLFGFAGTGSVTLRLTRMNPASRSRPRLGAPLGRPWSEPREPPRPR